MKPVAILLLVVALLQGGERFRYAIVLEQPPVAHTSGKAISRSAAQMRVREIRSAQRQIESAVRAQGLAVTAATQTLVNAVFVSASVDKLRELARLPGVSYVERLRPVKRHLDQALELVNAPAAWNLSGGRENAGTGVKIGILDTGIDQSHAAFQDDSLPQPPGFPKCSEASGDCAYTNRKVIVARSYVEMLSNYYGEDPRDTRPDDYSPRDRVGHGTAMAMVAAGVPNAGPVAAISGVAPKAFLGNYKIYGSPGVNDTTFDDVIIRALEDAFSDGMDIVVISSGHPAEWGPNDRGVCSSQNANAICDVRADAIENAARRGLVVVVSAGNDGDRAYTLPSYTSVHTPGTAPSAITVGATTNSHIYFQTVRSGEQIFNALYGDGPRAGVSGRIRDMGTLEADDLACTPLANDSLTGAIALIRRGECGFAVKVNHAQRAGAAAVVIYQPSVEGIFPMADLGATGIPAVLVGRSDGEQLRAIAQAGGAVTLDPASRAVQTSEFDTVAVFSSYGPSIRAAAIKPELVAVGTDLYMATQSFDPNGSMYDPSGYTTAQGTSFAAPMVAGAAALVKALHPSWNAAQIKSALVNTADERVDEYDDTGRLVRASVTAVGAGKLDAAEALKATVTAEPAALSFGIIGNNLPSRGITFRNGGASSASIRIEIQPRTSDRNARLEADRAAFTIAAGATAPVSFRLAGSRPEPGTYEGFVVVSGGGATLKIPYLYQIGDGVPFTVLPMYGEDFVTTPGGSAYLLFKVLDKYGVPVANAPVRFRSTLGGGSIDLAAERTDALGIAYADVFAGRQVGAQEFIGEVLNTNLVVEFFGRSRPFPLIETRGVVNAASLTEGQGLAPGSYISIYGRNLSEATRAFNTPYLPVSLAGVSVSFDVPSKRISVPARLSYVSPSQINVQIPWELQGSNSAIMKVSIGDFSSELYTVALQDHAPAAFEFADSSGRLLTAALKPDFSLVSTGSPAERGSVVQIYANGLGPVGNAPASGEVSPSEPLSQVRVLPVVTVGGRRAEVLFAGMAPFNVGLYQINVRIPSDTPAGLQPVVITSNGIISKTVNLPIQ